MSHRKRPLTVLALGAALLAGAPHGVRAQDVPAPPPLPGDPNAPAPPGNPTPPPFYPSFPGAPGGGGTPNGGSLGPGIPPPPPPPLETPNAPVSPAAPGPPSLPPGGPMAPGLQAPPADTTPPLPTPDAAPAAPKAVTLRYKFSPGQTTRYRLTANMDGTVQAGASGSAFPIKQQIGMTLHQTVKSVRASDGAATLVVQVDSVTMTMNGQAMPLPPQAQQQMTQPATLVMTPDGKVLSYQAPTGSPGMSSMGINPTDIQNARALPDKAVAAGDTWRSSYIAEALGLTTYAAYTLTRLSSDGGTATIAQKLYGEFKPAKAGAAGANSAPKMNGLMTGTGTEQFDIAAGQVAGQTADLQLKLTIALPGAASGAKTQFHIVTDMERLTNAAATAQTSPANEPPTGQLQ